MREPGTKRSGTKAAKDAAKCRRFVTGESGAAVAIFGLPPDA